MLLFIHYNYLVAIFLMMAGFYVVIVANNLVKKLIGLSIFQTSVLLFYISVGKVQGGTAPILTGVSDTVYSNPLPHVLMLTAIVVGIATIAVGLAIVVRINDAYGSIEENHIVTADNASEIRIARTHRQQQERLNRDPAADAEDESALMLAAARHYRTDKLAALYRDELPKTAENHERNGEHE